MCWGQAEPLAGNTEHFLMVLEETPAKAVIAADSGKQIRSAADI